MPTVQMPIRVDPELKRAIEEDAAENGRSREKHIIWLLRQHLKAKEESQVQRKKARKA